MASFSDYLENKIVNQTLRGIPYVPPSSVYIALHSNNPGESGNNYELTGNGYSRKKVEFSVPNNGVSLNENDIIFDTALYDWTPVTHMSIMDSEFGGNMLYYGNIPASITIIAGNNFRIPPGNLSVGVE
jgi:hypothetical protein